MIIFVKIPYESKASSTEAITAWGSSKSMKLGHFKKTCPNPHSGEKYHSFPPDGIIIDIVNNTGLWVTEDEYETMLKFTLPFCEISVNSLLTRDLHEEFKGSIAAARYDV